MNFITSKTFIATAGAILATGAALNLAGQGKLGTTAKKLANFITTGYGAGAIS